jgi:transcriptional regulator with XRE-family HTH domain
MQPEGTPMKTQKKPISNKELLASLRKDPEYKAAESHLETKIILARNVLRYRADRRLTQKELAEKAGMKQPRIADLESMKGNPGLDTLEKIATALEVSLSDLLSSPPPQMSYKRAAQSRKVAVDWLSLLQLTAGLKFVENAEAFTVESPMPFIESLFASDRLNVPQ